MGFWLGFWLCLCFRLGFGLFLHTEYEVLQIFDLGQIRVVQPPTQALIMVMKFNSTFLSIQNQCTAYSEINFFFRSTFSLVVWCFMFCAVVLVVAV